MNNPLLEHYRQVEDRIAAACQAAGRARADVSLLAVSKFHDASDIALLADAGQVDFGENYVQEASAKKSSLRGVPGCDKIRWHMIGHIQRRKAKDVAGEFELIHTLDSCELADGLEKRLVGKNVTQKALLEIKIAAEEQKSGVPPGESSRLMEHVLKACPHLQLEGLMCMPPVVDSGAAARPWFAALRKLRDDLETEFGIRLPELSMGMSADYPEAIAEGATIVRVGTSIFGPRPVKNRS